MKTIVGLVGNVCCGKSTVAQIFVDAGALHWDADAAVHQLHSDPEFKAAVRREFGGLVFNEDKINRAALGKIVFSSKAELDRLKAITFPRTKDMLREQVNKFAVEPNQILLLNAPTLFESGNQWVPNKLIFLTAPLARRLEWARGRGWPADELQKREDMLMPEAEKRRHCHTVIDNGGSLDDLKRAVSGWIAAFC